MDDVEKYKEEIDHTDVARYTKLINQFVNVDYETSDGEKKVAKGVLKDVIHGKLIIHDLKNPNKFWEIHYECIRNLHSKPVRDYA
jgi:hypothetical protein